MFTGSTANQLGSAISFQAINSTITSPQVRNPGPETRNATTLDITDNLTWLKGAHSITMGGQLSFYHLWQTDTSLVPNITLCCSTTTGLPSSDPAASFFNTTNFPGASSSQLIAAQGLFSLLTGRVSTIAADSRIDAATGKYVY